MSITAHMLPLSVGQIKAEEVVFLNLEASTMQEH